MPNIPYTAATAGASGGAGIPLSLPPGTFDDRGNFVFDSPQAKLSFLLNAFTPPQAPQPRTGFWSTTLPALLGSLAQGVGSVLTDRRQQNLQAQSQQRQVELSLFGKLLDNPELSGAALSGLSQGPTANQAPGFWGGVLGTPSASPAWKGILDTVNSQAGQPNPYLNSILGLSPGEAPGGTPVGRAALPAATTAAQPAGGASSLVQGTAPSIPGALGPASPTPNSPPPALASQIPSSDSTALASLFRPSEMTPEELRFTENIQGTPGGGAANALQGAGAPAAGAYGAFAHPGGSGPLTLDQINHEIMSRLGPPPPNEAGQITQLSPRQKEWLTSYAAERNRILDAYTKERITQSAPGFAQKTAAEQAALWTEQNLATLLDPDPRSGGFRMDPQKILSQVPPELQGYVIAYGQKNGWLPNTDQWLRREDAQANARELRGITAGAADERRQAAAQDAFARRDSDIGSQERALLEQNLPKSQKADLDLQHATDKLLKDHPEWVGGGLESAGPYSKALAQLKAQHAATTSLFSPTGEAEAILQALPPNSAGQALGPLVKQVQALPPEQRALAAQELYRQALQEATATGHPYYSSRVLGALRVILGLSQSH